MLELLPLFYHTLQLLSSWWSQQKVVQHIGFAVVGRWQHCHGVIQWELSVTWSACVILCIRLALFHQIGWPLDMSLVWLIDPEHGDSSVYQNAGIASTNDVVKHRRLKSYNDVHLPSLHITYLLFTSNGMKNWENLSVWILLDVISEFGILFPVKSYSSIKYSEV